MHSRPDLNGAPMHSCSGAMSSLGPQCAHAKGAWIQCGPGALLHWGPLHEFLCPGHASSGAVQCRLQCQLLCGNVAAY